jgi:hypothetical protein
MSFEIKRAVPTGTDPNNVNPLVKILSGSVVNRANLDFFNPIDASDRLLEERAREEGLDLDPKNTTLVGGAAPHIFNLPSDCPVAHEVERQLGELVANIDLDS